MPVSHIDFLEYSASELSRSEPTEFQLRNAASRAYYALYHKARQRIEELGLTLEKPEKAGSHAATIDTISRVSPKAKSISVQMDKLKRFRHICDYDLNSTIDKKRVELHIAEVGRMLDMLDRLQ
ncbi:hypothetical protein SAMN04244579_02413 [Azotobacter beijerinckii]|uniref:HEPN domain-containing protein n=1 Tax=Azotobacter beijerinckii TaxID=170623 RepID=A0A1H6UF53_9GAMM|nr:hypothetical protein [Azotobacter beijerinckii]SEI90951.1 hypothetical protein SAMN04244579_02413 [Azotobacter beijerinckii]